MSRHPRSPVWLLLVALAACSGQDGAESADAAVMDDDPDVAPAGDATGLPSGYALRLDREGSDPAEFHVMPDADGFHVQTGPAGVLWEESGSLTGDYVVSATFTEIEAPADHREGMGLIFGGTGLDGEAQSYSYFLVRADGHYLIKRREGEGTSNVSDGWIESDAVAASTGEGDVTNTLAVRVSGDQAHFMVNGEEVATFPAADLTTEGAWGYRINHNLNVRISEATTG